MWESVKSLLPTIGVLFVFWVAIRALVQADRRERAAQAKIEAAQDLQERQRRQEAQDRAAAGPDTSLPG